MAKNATLSTGQRIDQAKNFLVDFYQRPIAQVSTELFFTIITVIIFAAFAIRPTVITMTDLVKEIDDKETARQALDNKIASLSSLSSEFFTLQSQFHLMDETVMIQPQFEEIFKVIEKQASELQLSIVSFQLSEVPFSEIEETPFAQKDPIQANLTVNITGEYEKVREFILQIGTLRPLFTIDSVTISSAVSETQQLVSATVRLEVHYFGKKIAPPDEKPTTKTESDTDPKENL